MESSQQSNDVNGVLDGVFILIHSSLGVHVLGFVRKASSAP